MNQAPDRSPNPLFIAISILFSLLQHHGLVRLMENGYIASVQAAQGVVSGFPHWRVYQNRVLGPYLIDWASQFMPSFLFAHFFFSIAALAVAGYLACQLGYRIKNVATGLLAFFVFQSAFGLVLDRNWFYIWDSIDLVVFFLFVLFVVLEKSWIWFVGLFAVAIFNRESAQFIALWLIVDPLVRKALAVARGAGERLDWKPLAAGVACAALSVWLVELLRQTLLVEEIGFRQWNVPRGLIEFGPQYHFKLFTNLDLLRANAFTPSYTLPFTPLLCMLGFAGLAVAAAWRLGGKFISLAILQLGMLAGLLLFSLVYETRVFIQMLPFLALGVCVLAAGSTRAASDRT